MNEKDKQKNNLKVFEEFINRIQPKAEIPKNIDWSEVYYSQFEKRHKDLLKSRIKKE